MSEARDLAWTPEMEVAARVQNLLAGLPVGLWFEMTESAKEPPVYHRCPPDGGDCRDQIEVGSFTSSQPQYIPGACRHSRTVAVETVEGDVIAALCLCCDQQLPASWAEDR